MGKTIAGDVTLCNVLGPYDPSETGADGIVNDIFVLERLVNAVPTSASDTCKP